MHVEDGGTLPFIGIPSFDGRSGANSFDVIRYTGKQPDSLVPPVFRGATTRDPVSGIGAGREETLTFVAGRAGKYEFLCGVLGHAQAGMWNYLVVSSTAKAPSVLPAGAAMLDPR